MTGLPDRSSPDHQAIGPGRRVEASGTPDLGIVRGEHAGRRWRPRRDYLPRSRRPGARRPFIVSPDSVSVASIVDPSPGRAWYRTSTARSSKRPGVVAVAIASAAMDM
jgi:hypothetical protein